MPQNPTPNPPNPVTPPLGSFPSDFNTPYRCIKLAMFNAGLLGRGDEPDSEDLAEYMPRLNDLFNFLQTQGIKLWLQEDVAITLIAGINQYSFGPAGTVLMSRPPRIIEAYWQDNSGNSRPLIMLSRNEWNMLSTRVSQGSISNFFPDKQQLLTNFNTWLTPDASTAASGQVHVLAQIQVNNTISLYDAMNFAPEWFLGLQWGLSEQICTGQPPDIVTNCKEMATKYLTALDNWDVEDAPTQFQPDARSQYVANRFT